jgi:hypothetical protein
LGEQDCNRLLLVTLWLLAGVRVVEQQLQLLEAVGVALEVY